MYTETKISPAPFHFTKDLYFTNQGLSFAFETYRDGREKELDKQPLADRTANHDAPGFGLARPELGWVHNFETVEIGYVSSFTYL
jgi:hypothetical protein